MPATTLRQFEGDVEMARAKLTDSLARLRSPDTISAFADDLKKEALDTKDALIDQAKTAAQSKVTELVEELKAKAAANPAAALAIGAGLGWHFLRHPPIASALVGFGAFGLWKTDASRPVGSYRPDYLETGKERLKEQAGEALSKLKDMAIQGQHAVAGKTADLTGASTDTMQRWAAAIPDSVEDVGTSRRDAPSIAPSDDIGGFTQKASDMGGEVLHSSVTATRTMLRDPESRDKLLLGVAGLAVAAALGIACQKRLSEDALPGEQRL